MATPLTITTSRDQTGPVTLKITGEIDMSNADMLATAIQQQRGPLIIELSEVEYLDSAA